MLLNPNSWVCLKRGKNEKLMEFEWLGMMGNQYRMMICCVFGWIFGVEEARVLRGKNRIRRRGRRVVRFGYFAEQHQF